MQVITAFVGSFCLFFRQSDMRGAYVLIFRPLLPGPRVVYLFSALALPYSHVT